MHFYLRPCAQVCRYLVHTSFLSVSTALHTLNPEFWTIWNSSLGTSNLNRSVQEIQTMWKFILVYSPLRYVMHTAYAFGGPSYLGTSTQKCRMQSLELFKIISKSHLGISTLKCGAHKLGGISHHFEIIFGYINSEMWHTMFSTFLVKKGHNVY